MAYYNTHEIAYRAIPLVRRELDKELTIMVLTQVVVDVFTGLSYVTINGLLTTTNIINDSIILEKVHFASNVTLLMYYIYVSVNLHDFEIKHFFFN